MAEPCSLYGLVHQPLIRQVMHEGPDETGSHRRHVIGLFHARVYLPQPLFSPDFIKLRGQVDGLMFGPEIGGLADLVGDPVNPAPAVAAISTTSSLLISVPPFRV